MAFSPRALTHLLRPYLQRVLSASASPSPLTAIISRPSIQPPLLPRSISSPFAYIPMASVSTTPPAAKLEWLVIVPDKPGKQAKRLEVRAQHLAGVKPLVESGFVKKGGAIFNEQPEGDDPTKFSFYGSTLICAASSKEEILEKLKQDIYTKSDVWDIDNVQIWPAKFAA